MKVSAHLTEEVIEQYRAGNLSAAGWLAVQEHAGACAECRARLELAVDAGASLLGLREQLMVEDFTSDADLNHLSYEQASFYVDDKLDPVEREIADSHLAICQSCVDDIKDLRRYQAIAVAGMARPASTHVPTVAAEEAAAPTLQAESAPERETPFFTRSGAWLRRLFSFNLFPATGRLAPLGMAAVVVALLLAGIWLATRTKTPGNGDGELAKVKTVNQAPAPTIMNGQSNQTPLTQNRNTSNGEATSTPVISPTPRPSTSQPPAEKPQRPPASISSPAVTLNDGSEQVAFDREGNLNGLESLPASVRQAVRWSINAQQAQTPRFLDAIAEGNTGVLMSGSAEATNNGVPFALLSPVGRVVRESRPTLNWRPLAGAKSYTVAVVDANFRVVAQSPRLTVTTWTLNQALPRGANYSWQITAVKLDGAEIVSPVAPAPQAKFRVMEQSAFDEVLRLENSGVRSHLARGVVYAQAGLLDEARAEFEALVKDNPRSQLARKLLNSVKK